MGSGSIQKKSSTTKKTMELTECLYVPDLTASLFSISAVTKKGFSVSFEDEKYYISKHGIVYGTGTRSKGLYLLDVKCTHDTALISLEEHQGRHHFNKRGDKASECIPCIEGKLARSKTKKQTARIMEPEEENGDKAGDVLHTDVYQFSKPTNGGAKYCLTFVDGMTRYTIIYLIKRKSDVFSKLKKTFAWYETQLNIKVKAIRDDKRGVYVSKEMSIWKAKE